MNLLRGGWIIRPMDYCFNCFKCWPLFAFLFVWVFAAVTSSSSVMLDECDWTGSGLTTSSTSRGVTPVYLRCSAGRVTWLYPRGALRVLLRLPDKNADFRACIKVHSDGGKHSPIRLFLEGPRSLLPLYAHDDGGYKSPRCFQSKNGLAAIYVEATEVDTVSRRVADIEYDLQPLPNNAKAYDPAEECRPCSEEEIAHIYCTSDLVTRGTIHGVDNHLDTDQSQLQIRITKLIRHTTDDTFSSDLEDNLVMREGPLDVDSKEVLLHVPRHCGVSHGTGEFVFMARRKLGDLALLCAPRLEDWALLINKLSDEGKAHCMLRS